MCACELLPSLFVGYGQLFSAASAVDPVLLFSSATFLPVFHRLCVKLCCRVFFRRVGASRRFSFTRKKQSPRLVLHSSFATKGGFGGGSIEETKRTDSPSPARVGCLARGSLRQYQW